MPTNTVSIKVTDPAKPTKTVSGIPWYPGITVLEAMVIGQELCESWFSFRVVYASFYGAFVDMIDGTEDRDPYFWMFSVDNSPSQVGVSEAILLENNTGQNVEIEWSYQIPQPEHAGLRQIDVKRKMQQRG